MISSNNHQKDYQIILDEMSQYVQNFSVGFVNLIEDREPIDANLAGSGTLISVGDIYAIITADHVITNLPSSGNVGLILSASERSYRYVIDMASVQKLRIAPKVPESKEPDLAIIILNSLDAKGISVYKSFYNLNKRKDKVLSNPLSINNGIWALEGIAEEETKEEPLEWFFQKVKKFGAICGVGIVINEYEIGNFDYLEFEAKYNNAYEGPNSFKGFSGGGLWQFIPIKDSAGVFHISETILSGVIFYESDLAENIRLITCHGRKSIYKIAFDELSKSNS